MELLQNDIYPFSFNNRATLYRMGCQLMTERFGKD